MSRAWRFHIAMILITMVSVLTVIIAECSFDASSAVFVIILGVIVILGACLSLLKSSGRLPFLLRLLLNLVRLVCIIAFIWIIFSPGYTPISRAFALAHCTLVLMICKFISLRRTRDYAQIFIFSLLLMVIGAVTTNQIILIIPYLLYMLLAGYALIVYQLQRQVELVTASQFIGFTPSAEDIDNARSAVKRFWKQLGHTRFGFTCLCMFIPALLLAGVMFLAFPRLEKSSLFGAMRSASSGAFSGQLLLGSIDKNTNLYNIVARVSLSQNGKPLGHPEKSFLLRSTVLDRYHESPQTEGQFLWYRSGLGYFSSVPFESSSAEDSAPVVKQHIFLNPMRNLYLPATYPVKQIENITNPKVSLLDHVVTLPTLSDYTSLDYTATSTSQITPSQAHAWFKDQISLLGSYWVGYCRDRYGISDDIRNLALDIVGDLAYQRAKLYQQQLTAFHKWSRHWLKAYDYSYPEETMFLPLPMIRRPPQIDDNMKALNNALMYDFYRRSIDLAQIDRAIAAKIISYLQQNHTYTLDPPPPAQFDEELEYYLDPVEEFLLYENTQGNCEYFASAMIMLCRSLHLQARLALGYLMQEYIPELDYYLVRQRDAHSWVEIYTADADWISFDPTPPALVSPASQSRSYLAHALYRLSVNLEALQYRWAQFSLLDRKLPGMDWAEKVGDWITNLESSRRLAPESDLSLALRSWFTHQPDESYFGWLFRWLIFFLFLIDLGIGLRELFAWLIPAHIRRRRRKRNLSHYTRQTAGFYRRMLEILQRINIYKPPALTAREFAFQIMPYSRDFAPIGTISEAYYHARFSKSKLSQQKQKAIENALKHLDIFTLSVKKTVPRPWPWENQD